MRDFIATWEPVQAQLILGGQGKKSRRELECQGQECGFILKATRLQMPHHSLQCRDHEKHVRFIN